MNIFVKFLLSLLITIFILLFQRITGPTYPRKFIINDNQVKLKTILIRSANNNKKAQIVINGTINNISAKLFYKKYKFEKNYNSVNFSKINNKLIAYLEPLPAGGKYEYYILVNNHNSGITYKSPKTIIRFKNPVPTSFILLHIIFIFSGFFMSSLTFIESITKKNSINSILKKVKYSIILFFIGGLIFGPIIQKYAFNVWWSGFPFNIDLTDNKMLILQIFWTYFYYKAKKTNNLKYIIYGFILIVLVFLVPHSILGSEYDFKEGKHTIGY